MAEGRAYVHRTLPRGYYSYVNSCFVSRRHPNAYTLHHLKLCYSAVMTVKTPTALPPGFVGVGCQTLKVADLDIILRFLHTACGPRRVLPAEGMRMCTAPLCRIGSAPWARLKLGGNGQLHSELL